MLTLASTKEIRGATWDEFHDLDGDAPIWRIPAARMKAKRAHDVPLSRQAVEVLRSCGDTPATVSICSHTNASATSR